MKLRSLDIESYGLYRDRSFDFAPHGVQVIYGPNEAGKSTLLQLLRDVLFGIRTEESYRVDDSQPLAVVSTWQMDDGRALHFRREEQSKLGRRKKGVVKGTLDGRSSDVDSEVLTQLLGAMPREIYEKMFAFSARELEEGEDALQHATLTEALFGGSAGGLGNLKALRKQIENEHRELFKVGGKNPTINKLLKQLRSDTEAMQAATISPREYDERCQQRDEFAAAAQKLREDLTQLRQQDADLEKRIIAHPIWQQRCAAIGQLNDLILPEKLTIDSVTKCEELAEKIKVRTAEIDELRADIETGEAEQQSIDRLPDLLTRAGEILAAVQKIEQVEQALADRPGLADKANRLRTEIDISINQLPEDAGLKEYSIEDPDAVLEALQEIRDERQELTSQQTVAATQRSTAQQALDEATHTLEELPPCEQLPMLKDVQSRRATCDIQTQQCEERAAELTELDRTINQTSQTLAVAVAGEANDIAGLTLPLRAAVIEFNERFDRCEAEQASAQKELTKLRGQIRKLEGRINSSSEQCELISAEQLAGERAHRNHSWRLLRRWITADQADRTSVLMDAHRWLDDGGESAGATLAELIAAFERALPEADRLSDLRYANASELAKAESQRRELLERQHELATAEEVGSAASDQLANCEAQWQSLWSETGITPRSPAVMLEWMAKQALLVEKVTQRDRVMNEWETLTDDIRALNNELLALAPDDATSVEVAVAWLTDQIETGEQTVAERTRLATEIPKLKAKVTRHETPDESLVAAQDDWQQSWRQLREACGLSDELEFKEGSRTIKLLAEISRQQQRLANDDERLGQIDATLDRFNESVTSLTADVAADLSDYPPVEAARLLHERLQLAQQADANWQAFATTLAKSSRTMEQKTTERKTLQVERQTLIAQAGFDDEATFAEACAVVKQANALQADIDGYDGRLRDTFLGAFDAEALATELDDRLVEDLKTERTVLQQDVEEVEHKSDEKTGELRLLKQSIDAMKQESHAAELQQEIEFRHRELSDAIARWSQWTLAGAVLELARKRFEKERQPKLLEDVAAIFSRLTEGRYEAIDRKLDEAGTFEIRQHDGRTKTPAKLSTGSAQQLFLAIRIAYLREHAEKSETLPIVMDDVLVHFDADRARQTFKVLDEMSDEFQILLLTCHHHVCELATEVNPDAEPILLVQANESTRFIVTQ